MERAILHCDLNNFYASVECMLHPELKNKYIIVGGSAEDRHGIVLAKNQKAKACGIKTGEAIWQARQKCKGLVVIEPHHDEYAKYSKLTRQIYYKYTNFIEPFGIDECWLDITASTALFGTPYEIAYKIKEEIKSELGLTISVGISFNKIFAKLGSDLKKPDAITEITSKGFKEEIWHLPARLLIGIGKATKKKLDSHCIYTIGDLANCDVDFLTHKFGKCGYDLWLNANGLNDSKVCNYDCKVKVKSISHGTTTKEDLENNAQVWTTILALSQDIASQLKEKSLIGKVVQIEIKDMDFLVIQHEGKMIYASDSALYIAKKAYELFLKNYTWDKFVRGITVRIKDLYSRRLPVQLDMFSSYEKQYKQEKAEATVEQLRNRFGDESVLIASLK